ncbi:MAG: Na+/H+ antiporter subunit E [Gammaproteobacteria bacterium]|nr:Na+/H+ antiporter subunit E [Gammaproteobacteria bacterium]
MKSNRLGIVTAIVVLALLWIALSGYFTILQLSLGAISCLFVLWLSVRLELLPEETRRISLIRLVAYLIWLVQEIISSNFRIARIVLSRRPELHRRVVHSKVKQRTTLGVAIYANSITLTPGTVTLDAEADDLSVHVLTRRCADDLLGDEMNQRVAGIEGRP